MLVAGLLFGLCCIIFCHSFFLHSVTLKVSWRLLNATVLEFPVACLEVLKKDQQGMFLKGCLKFCPENFYNFKGMFPQSSFKVNLVLARFLKCTKKNIQGTFPELPLLVERFQIAKTPLNIYMKSPKTQTTFFITNARLYTLCTKWTATF